jgi:hypothetical protein
MDRTKFFPKSLAYLCSFDFDSKQKGALGSQMLVFDEKSGSEGDAPVYNALDQEFVFGEIPIRGQIQVLELRVKYPDRQEHGELEGRLTMFTDDGAVLEAGYHGVFHAGPQWHWLTAQGSPVASQAARRAAAELQVRACISLRFDTGSTKYRWVVQYQCVGYGRMCLRDGVPVSGTFDVHAMTVPNDVREAVSATG